MCYNNITNVGSLYFSNSAYIDGAYPNQFNFHANNSYYFGNLRFYGSGLTLDIADNIIQNVATIYGSSGGYLTLNANNAMVIENNQGARQALNSDGSFEFRTTGANKTVYINAEAMTFIGGSNNRINDLGHIYGNTSASGGGLAIDYMYGLFFNSAGNNANLYASGPYLNMNNFNGGTSIGCYNAAGTGNLSLYCASNDLYIATGTGKSVIINSGSNISLNAANPGGTFGVYTSTINSYSLLDTNLTALQNFNVNVGGSAQLHASYFSFFNDCYFNNTDLHDMRTIYFGFGPYINRNIPGGFTNAFLDIHGAGGDGQLRLINGSAEIALRGNSDLGITPTSGARIVLNGPTAATSTFTRTMSSTDIAQPIIQYGTATGSGASGSVNVSLPVAYSSASSYIVTASMMDVDAARMSVNRNSASNITIYWFQAGSGTQTLGWTTMGS
jgi:hypothetical protein